MKSKLAEIKWETVGWYSAKWFHETAILNNLTIKFIVRKHAYPQPSRGLVVKGVRGGLRGGRKEKGGWKRPQPYIGGLSYRTFTLQSCVVIYGCRSLIRRIRTPLSPHVCCPSIDPIYRDETGVHEVSRPPRPPILVDDSSRGVKSRGKRKLIEQRATDRDL